ncbi:hypothetical protein HMF7854_04240 [Sphingomonas ginkgonis]|uniref:Uncharacterized protein n=1 Tax=Sphingomonas ginkgonis TaxID=2315330 RepID=A0A3R9WMS9_9SPHN|nr:hypothetical protein [Sphingomonas ginkgonis]RST30120.1 hypothetical protein HMF7854_04240 [Sphingomonas ginkgonis]
MFVPFQPDPRIKSVLSRFGFDEEAAITPLAELKREIHQYGERRCDKEASRDNLIYYLGFAFAVNEALDVDSLGLTGLLSIPLEAFATILVESDEPAEGSDRLIDALRYALSQPAVLGWARAKGVWLQWKRLEVVYRKEIIDFRKSDAFDRPGWRKRSITKAQHYMVGEIVRILGVANPRLATRGEAFNFIAHHGGNPRFLVEPPAPANFWEA